MDTLLQDLRHAFRSLARSPGFTIAVVVTLALGIGANTAVFTLVRSALIRSLPYADPERLVHLWCTNGQGGQHESSYPDYLDWKAENGVFDEIGGYVTGMTGVLSGTDAPEAVRLGRATSTFFPALGVAPRLGRGFTAEEERPEAESVAILSDAIFVRRFGADPGILDKTILLNGRPRLVVGVLPRNFQFAPDGGADIWIAARPSKTEGSRRNYWWLNVVARLKPGVSLETAAAAMKTRAAQLERAFPASNTGLSVRLVRLRDQIVGPVRPVLLALMVAVGFVLLIACTNVANLFLVRSVGRRTELAVRQALGARRRHLLQPVLVESGVLGVLGGALGLLFSSVVVPLLLRAIPEKQRALMPYLNDLRPDAGVLFFTLAVSLGAALLFGLGSAIRSSKGSLVEDLGRTAGARLGSRRRAALVVAEMALAVVLLVGAGLMIRSTLTLLREDTGFDTEGLLTARVTLSPKESDKDRILAFHARMLEVLRALPGARTADVVDILPLGGEGGTGFFDVAGRPPATLERRDEANLRTVSPEYFRDMRVPLRAGRTFDGRDNAAAPIAVIVNEALARKIFPDDDPVGHRIRFNFDDKQPFMEIVGLVGNERILDIAVPPAPVIYGALAQDPPSSFHVLLRTTGDPRLLAGPVTAALHSLDGDLLVNELRPMRSVISDSPSAFNRRYPAVVLGAFAGMALFLAALGVHGVLSYSVAQRRREIGIRLAIGAEPGDVVRLVLGEGLVLAARGLLFGLLGALFLTQVLRSLLFGVRPTDPATFIAIAVLFLAAALFACWLPARRAAGVDPAVALRAE